MYKKLINEWSNFTDVEDLVRAVRHFPYAELMYKLDSDNNRHLYLICGDITMEVVTDGYSFTMHHVNEMVA